MEEAVTWKYIYYHDYLRKKVKEKMFEKGINQKELADELNYHPVTISSYMSGKNNNKHLAMALITYFDLNAKDFM